MPLFTWLSSGVYRLAPGSIVLKTILCLLLLLVPTTLFGAVWPFISSYYLRQHAQKGSRIGKIYSVNSIGSALGAFSSGFILIPVLGIMKASFFAAALNLVAGFITLRLAGEKNEKK